ncbi:L-threonylcarbamoyladenylate synthase [Paenibacillus thermotolerans]|uniref:L-threonylcarbamoyladenylate synthase n=1 Tax=Paenibacillus thermotolerans TaxID=3027807 RepID=UPI002368E677|nr:MULTISPECIES: L-threonylcarbamoyladenylate synthase [unclassified Paenibacillus]
MPANQNQNQNQNPIGTKLWNVQHIPSDSLRGNLSEAAALLREGALVAFPTETVYGLGADARNTEAVERIFAAKGRPSDNPLIVHIADVEAAEQLAEHINETERRLIERFWPGPLTLVLPVRPGAVSPRVTAGLDTVAVRMPAHETALALIAQAGVPVAAPSANRSGRPSPTLARHVQEDLQGRIEGIVDGGPTDVGLESTVARVDEEGAVHILRPGGITAESLRDAGFIVAAHRLSGAKEEEAPRSPGMKYTHYAPKGRLCVVEGAADAVRAHIQNRVDDDAAQGLRTAVLAFAPTPGAALPYRADYTVALGERGDATTAAHKLYAALRECDARDIARIYAEAVDASGLGFAFMNRLEKAAGGNIIRV